MTAQGSNELLRRLRDDLIRVLGRQARADHNWRHGTAQTVGQVGRTDPAVDEQGGRQISTAMGERDSISTTIPAASPGLSGVPPIGELLRIRQTEADDDTLTAQLSGLERQYGPFRLGEVSAHYEFPGPPDLGQRYQFPHRSTDDRTTITMSATVFDDARGVDVGNIRRNFYLDEQGRPVVHNENIYLDEEARGQGFGGTVTRALEDYYRRSGVHAMYHVAGDEDGGVVWARADHRFDTEPLFPGDTELTLLGDSVGDITRRIHEVYPTVTPADKQRLTDLAARFEGRIEDYPTPNDIVRITGDARNLGEQVMRGSYWWAMKIL
ncbi:GNAT family N-acetyltransferase [Nocardia abscessus]|uniref:GNAT family N-acetyltransferase n=1 Tax=Nocardia abscessus TaxID=120957 RepID=UPI0012F8D80D|nr:GNAT family N-acetyltransferase [Nocardia abscessus]MCC3332092.1 GNAT family N-acetyltransferase [Nocardia abscessus]